MKKYLLSIGLLLVSLSCQASFNEGVAAYNKGDFQAALKAWKTVAEEKPTVSDDFEWRSSHSKNTTAAQYALGLLYWQGKGVSQNYHEAEKWLALAASSGHSEAQLKLAYLHLTGLNGQVNVTEAIKWFEQSAQQGNVDAQYNLGLLYFKGLGITKDPVHAKKWLSLAAQQGESSAKELLAKIDIPAPQEIPQQTQFAAVSSQAASVSIAKTEQTPIASPPVVSHNTEKLAPQPLVTNQQIIAKYSPTAAGDDIIKNSSDVPTFSLSGSKWHYIDKDWHYDLEFAENGVLITTHPNDKTKDNDSWEQDGNRVHFYFNNKFSHFEGTLSGNNVISGTAITKNGSSWTWKASRAD